MVFSLLDSDFSSKYINVLVFFGVERTLADYLKKASDLGIKNYSLQKKQKKYRQSIREFHEILMNENPDVVIVHNSELIYAAVKYKKVAKSTKIIFVEHEPNHSKTFFEKIISKYAAKKADTVICLNQSYKLELTEKYNYKANVVVVPNGLNTDRFQRNTELSSIKTIGMAARLVDTKDHANLLRAFSRLLSQHPELTLKIAGIGDKHKHLLGLAEQLKIEKNVQFVGLLDESGMIEFYNSIDLCVHATLSETLSTSILQAMSCEKIVITSDIENNRLLIEDGVSGVLYKNNNSEDLFLKMTKVVNNVDEYKSMGVVARKKVIDEYSNILMSNNYENVIEK